LNQWMRGQSGLMGAPRRSHDGHYPTCEQEAQVL
jgi:hypothetical protein